MSCPCGKPAPDGNLCPACGEQIRQNLTTIADRWGDLEQALTRRETHAGEQGKMKRSMVASGTSLNEAAVRARRACTDVVWFILQVIRDDLDAADRPFTPPRIDSRTHDATPRLARWIAAWQVSHITHRTSPETAEEILTDVARAEQATFDALKEYARTVPTGLPCEHHGTSDLGERVPCVGVMEARLGDQMPDLVCSVDASHRIPPDVWSRQYWKRAHVANEAGARRLVDKLRN